MEVLRHPLRMDVGRVALVLGVGPCNRALLTQPHLSGHSSCPGRMMMNSVRPGSASTTMVVDKRGEMACTPLTTSGCGKRKKNEGDGGGRRHGLAKPCPKSKDYQTGTCIISWHWLRGYQCPEFGPGATALHVRLGLSHNSMSFSLTLTNTHTQPLLQTIGRDTRLEVVGQKQPDRTVALVLNSPCACFITRSQRPCPSQRVMRARPRSADRTLQRTGT